jgi:hypothetical protein
VGVQTERRLHERYAIPVTLYHEVDGSLVHYTTRNVSLGGAFVLTGQPPAIGTRLVLFLDLPKKKLLQVNPGTLIEVVRHDKEGMGVRFVDPPDDFMQMLREEFKRRFAERAAGGAAPGQNP